MDNKMNMWRKLQVRRKMIKAFRTGNFYLGDIERPIFPKIHSVDIKEQFVCVSFTLPNGLDPNLLKNNFYVFQQYFGREIELEGEIKNYILTVYNTVMPSVLPYNYDSFTPLKELNIPIVAGSISNGEVIVYDMVKNPHLLIAGETGSGKSTQLRSILTTLIKTLPPERLELYLCDLKRSEFHPFRNVNHVRGVYVSIQEMLPALQNLQREMRLRGDLLDLNEVSHIEDLGSAAPPYIVLCIDEVALMQDERELMQLVEEISAIGRALGVFLILSMQRPDRKVLDGKLKNNLTVRMGFKCADLINSRIIGTPGSEKLQQEGRLLLKLPAFSALKEIQAPYLSLQDAKKLLEFYKSIKNNNAKKHPSVRFEKELDTEEIKENIFGVLDE